MAMVNFFTNFDGTNTMQEEEAAHYLAQLDCTNLAKAGNQSSKKAQKICQNQLNLSNLIREVFQTHGENNKELLTMSSELRYTWW